MSDNIRENAAPLINNTFDNVYITDEGDVLIFSPEFGPLTLQRRRDIAEFPGNYRVLLNYSFEVKGATVFVSPPN